MFDEPTSALDPERIGELPAVIHGFVEEGQITAGRAIGLSKPETIYYAVLP